MLKSTKDSSKFPFDLVKEEVAKVERAISAQAASFDPGVEAYVSYVCNSSGKRIRPALTILAGGATGEINDDHRQLGLILELVHIATLVHDDIMDHAELRRGAPTASARWGNSLSVLLGDSMFAHALMLAADFEDREICKEISSCSREVCTGEILQTQRQFDLQLSIPDYYKIIEMKTAALFGAATQLSAKLNGSSDQVIDAMRTYGRKLGTAYQIYDDCLDLVGEPESAGKTLRTDLAKGKLTLPILKLLASANDQQREKLGRLLVSEEPVDVSALAGIADYEGAIESAIRAGKDIAIEARDELVILDKGDHAEALRGITFYLEDLFDSCQV